MINPLKLTNPINLTKKMMQIKVLNHFLINNKVGKNTTFFSLQTIRVI